MNVNIHKDESVWVVEIDRPDARNAVDGATAQALADAFHAFDADHEARVAVLCGAGGTFCAGADLKSIDSERGAPRNGNPLNHAMDHVAPMGPTRMRLSKPVIAAVDGYAVAGGMELALWCDLRVVDEGAVFGIFCRRFGVPLIDGGTVRLPRLIGMSRALDLILTGRPVGALEALQMGLANRVVSDGTVRAEAIALAHSIAKFPQQCMVNDRASVYEQDGLDFLEAMTGEFKRGLDTLGSGETAAGAASFRRGQGRHGRFK
jgi:enoyl-CoA hydratase